MNLNHYRLLLIGFTLRVEEEISVIGQAMVERVENIGWYSCRPRVWRRTGWIVQPECEGMLSILATLGAAFINLFKADQGRRSSYAQSDTWPLAAGIRCQEGPLSRLTELPGAASLKR